MRPITSRALTDANTLVSYSYAVKWTYLVTAKLAILTTDDYLQLTRFWRETCRGPAVAFDWLHADDMLLENCRWLDKAQSIRRTGPNMLDVTVNFTTETRPEEVSFG